MYDIVRDAAIGQVIRYLSRKRFRTYLEERPEFQLPLTYARPVPTSQLGKNDNIANICHDAGRRNIDFPLEQPKIKTGRDEEERGVAFPAENSLRDESIQKEITLITWYSDTDPENPQNWSLRKKLWVSFILLIYSFSVYVGSSLYTASIPGLVKMFNIGEVVASLGLSLYVIGYGLGPLLFSPLSEIPAIGRNPPYIVTYTIFVLLCLPTALVNNFGGLLALRLLLGFFGSPCLATAGASHGDFFRGTAMPYVIALWACGATVAPALGPVIGGFVVQARNWRWSNWVLLWISAPILILMFVFLPETSSDSILYQRAKRLRALTGRDDLRSESEIKHSQLTAQQITWNALIKPCQINMLDPAMLFNTIYTALTYGIYYSFFESFPLVYSDMYGFNLGQTGLAFLANLVGLIISVTLYCAYFYFIGNPKMAGEKAESFPPEARLWPGLYASFFLPIGLFIFAWTARPSIHWIVSLVGVAISMGSIFIITQCMLLYLPFSYPQYAGSLFAANAFARSALAAGAILFSRPMFLKLGVAGGVSLLGGLTILCIVGIYTLYYFGENLRKRSRFAVS